MSDDNAEAIRAIILDCSVETGSRDYGTGYFTNEIDQMVERIAALEAAQPSPVQGTDDEREALIGVMGEPHEQGENGVHIVGKGWIDLPYYVRREMADAILAAGFSRRSPSVADLTAKAEAWDEGVIAKSNSSSIFDRDVLAKNPYRTPVTGEDKA